VQDLRARSLIPIKDVISYPWNVPVEFSMEATMFRLASILYSLIATTLAGTAVIAVLTAGYGTLVPILAAAAVGAVVALPVSWYVARAIMDA
jgi:hypothetical protein